MTVAVRTALAVPFAWTSAGTSDITVVFPSATGTIHVAVPSNTYRLSLAAVDLDFLREMRKRINLAISAASGAETVSITISDAGRVTITFSAAITSMSFGAASTAWLLGLAESGGVVSGATSSPIVGARPPWYLALFAGVIDGVWQPVQTGGAEQLSDGRVYSVGATATAWQRTCRATRVPWSPAMRAAYETGATAMWPADAYLDALGSTATDREWSLLDVLQVARNAVCGLALGTWQTVRTSTTERYDRVYVALATLLSPVPTRQDEAHEAWVELPLTFSRPATSPTDTRA